MKGKCLLVSCLLVLLVAVRVEITEAVICNAIELSSCASAITTSTPPSKLCCRKIKEQQPCLCNYLKNPSLKKFVNTPNARRVASTCGTPFPRC
ncbi:hypothetical protein SAY87_007689 [Trapa incisa]|uniref:Bifunctional inhibitor/plant lipid transfer protein/seed storage helical domain-containing protein n=2 Tax=Trapa TaxID=22665 RepID=A0AAN7L9A2_TRANT|nr:hypothetical protein SAY87_007689 [Trapa incisa]KAK4776961.1 hypothetical protein SAY86_005649 [Trapa natans]